MTVYGVTFSYYDGKDTRYHGGMNGGFRDFAVAAAIRDRLVAAGFKAAINCTTTAHDIDAPVIEGGDP